MKGQGHRDRDKLGTLALRHHATGLEDNYYLKSTLRYKGTVCNCYLGLF